MKSGMLAAEAIYPHLIAQGESQTVASLGACDPEESPIEAKEYEKAMEDSWVYKELYRVRNSHSAFKAGLFPGMVHTAFSTFLTGGHEPWSLKNDVPDSAKTELAAQHSPIDYPKPDGKVSFDLLTNLTRSGTSHEHDQPSHLKIKTDKAHVPSGELLKNSNCSNLIYLSIVGCICSC